MNKRQTSYFHQQILEVLDSVENPADLKIIVVPDAAIAVAIRVAASRNGHSLVNIETVTASGLATHVFKSISPSRAGQVVKRSTMELVCASFLSGHSEPEATTMLQSVSALVSSVLSDQEKGRGAAWAAGRVNTPRQRLYAEYFEFWQEWKKEHDLLDQVDLLDEAIRLHDAFVKERNLGVFAVCGRTRLTPKQLELVEAIRSASGKGVLIGADAETLPAGFAASELNHWRRPNTACPEVEKDAPNLIQAATRREEMFTVLGKIIEERIPFDDVEIAFTNDSLYRIPILAICQRLKIPVSGDYDADLVHRYMEGLLGAYNSCFASSFAPESIISLLRSGHLDGGKLPGAGHKLAADLFSLQAHPGLAKSERVKQALAGRARQLWISPTRLSAALQFLDQLRPYVPGPTVRPSEYVSGFRRFVTDFSDESIPTYSKNRFIDDALSVYEDPALSEVSGSWLISHVSKGLPRRTARLPETGNGILLVHASQAGFGPRSHTFLMGLDDEATQQGSPVKAGHLLELDAGDPHDELFGQQIPMRDHVTELHRRLGDKLVLSLPAYSVGEDRHLYPSSALLQLVDLEEIQPCSRRLFLDHADIGRHDLALVVDAFPALERGRIAADKRNGPGWSPFDGVVAGIRPIDHVSPSRLETLAECPFRYFLKYSLALAQPEDEKRDWIEKNEEGSLLHALFEEHAKKRIDDQGLNPKKNGLQEQDEKEMLNQLRFKIREHASVSSGSSSAFQELKYLELADGVRQYFAIERRNAREGRAPLAVEYSFGHHEDSDHPPVPIDPALGETSITGRIDRIDKTDSGELVIVDYKTGKSGPYLPSNLLKLDGQLQWAVYALAAESALNGRVLTSEYVFTSRREGGRIIRASIADRKEVVNRIAVLLGRHDSGGMIQAADDNPKGVCKWCDYKAVCGDISERKKELKAKVDSDSILAEQFAGWQFFPRLDSTGGN